MIKSGPRRTQQQQSTQRQRSRSLPIYSPSPGSKQARQWGKAITRWSREPRRVKPDSVNSTGKPLWSGAVPHAVSSPLKTLEGRCAFVHQKGAPCSPPVDGRAAQGCQDHTERCAQELSAAHVLLSHLVRVHHARDGCQSLPLRLWQHADRHSRNLALALRAGCVQ